jgi:hypothetical protein
MNPVALAQAQLLGPQGPVPAPPPALWTVVGAAACALALLLALRLRGPRKIRTAAPSQAPPEFPELDPEASSATFYEPLLAAMRAERCRGGDFHADSLTPRELAAAKWPGADPETMRRIQDLCMRAEGALYGGRGVAAGVRRGDLALVRRLLSGAATRGGHHAF